MTTIAGNVPGTPNPQFDSAGDKDGIGTKASFSSLYSIAYSVSEHVLYVGSSVLRRIDLTTLNVTTLVPRGPSIIAAYGLAVTRTEPILVVVCQQTTSLYLIHPHTGQTLLLARPPLDQRIGAKPIIAAVKREEIRSPWSVAIDEDEGCIFMGDDDTHRIYRITLPQ